MKCLMCENLSLTHICPTCQKRFLTPSLYRRQLPNGIEVLSFYNYKEIKELLFTKHTDLGFHIYSLLAKLSLKKFTEEFEFDERVISVAIDDNVKSGYSHTALLNRSLKSRTIKPLHNRLRAKSDISYSGKTREFRLLHPREFELRDFQEKNVIVVDDIITTGTTLTQATQLLQRAEKEVLFCLTLSDVSKN
jgi:competence protein ComFC